MVQPTIRRWNGTNLGQRRGFDKKMKQLMTKMTSIRTLCIMGLVLFALGCATPAPRVALVVGHADYEHASPLTSPAHDADAVAHKLRELGWEVTAAVNLPREGFEQHANAFEAAATNAAQVLFFYAGHSMEIDGDNYIVPIEFDPANAEFDRDLVSIRETVRRFKHEEGQLAVLLDASRDNPLSFEVQRALRNRGRRTSTADRATPPSPRDFGIGLAEVPAEPGTFVAYATAPGHVALDGRGKHSPFTRALLEHMDFRDQDIATVLVLVRDQVVEDSGGTQVPWNHSSLTEPFSINPAPEDAPAP